MSVKNPDALLVLCIREMTNTRKRLHDQISPTKHIGDVGPAAFFEPTFDEYKKAYITALFSEMVAHLFMNDWDDMPPGSLSPGEVRMGLSEVLERVRRTAEGLDKGAKYEVTLIRK